MSTVVDSLLYVTSFQWRCSLKRKRCQSGSCWCWPRRRGGLVLRPRLRRSDTHNPHSLAPATGGGWPHSPTRPVGASVAQPSQRRLRRLASAWRSLPTAWQELACRTRATRAGLSRERDIYWCGRWHHGESYFFRFRTVISSAQRGSDTRQQWVSGSVILNRNDKNSTIHMNW